MDELLYHYTSQNGLLGIINNNNIWATNLHFLNDSKEFIHAIELTKSIILEREQDEKNSILLPLYNDIKDRLERYSTHNIYVTSFSKERDQLSQWRGYCHDEQGFSIGFSKKIIDELAKRQDFIFNSCEYDQSTKQDTIIESLNQTEEHYKKNPNPDSIVTFSERFFISRLLHFSPLLKHYKFSEEKEWRIFSRPLHPVGWDELLRTGKTTLVPYIEFKLDFVDSVYPIREVIVGPGQNNELAKTAIQNFFLQKKLNIQVNLSDIPYRTT